MPSERAKVAKLAVLDRLYRLRRPQYPLEPRFDHQLEDRDIPVMRYGIPLTDEELVKCAEALRVAPSEEDQKRDSYYLIRTRDRLSRHLKNFKRFPETTTIADSSDGTKQIRVLSLYSNYDHPAEEEALDRLTAVLQKSLGLRTI